MKTKLNVNLILCTFILAILSLVAKPSAQIVPQIIQYFNGSGTARGGIVVPGSIFITGTGNGLGVGNLSIFNTTPTLGANWGTSPSIASSNGTFTFKVNVGGGGVATTGTVNLATATTGWNCVVQDDTNNTVTRVTGNTVSSVSVTAAAAWAANDILSFICAGF